MRLRERLERVAARVDVCAAGRRTGAAPARPSAAAPSRGSGSGHARGRTRSGRGRGRRGRTARSGGHRRRSRRRPRASARAAGRRWGRGRARARRRARTAAARRAPARAPPSAARLRTASAWRCRQRRSSSGNSSSAWAMPLRASSRLSAYVATRRFSSTVRFGSSWRPSGTIATPAARICSGRRRVRSASPIVTVPEVGRSTPPTVRTSVDFPAPFGPSRAVTSPGGIVMETSRSTRRPPRVTERPLNERFVAATVLTRCPPCRGTP